LCLLLLHRLWLAALQVDWVWFGSFRACSQTRNEAMAMAFHPPSCLVFYFDSIRFDSSTELWLLYIPFLPQGPIYDQVLAYPSLSPFTSQLCTAVVMPCTLYACALLHTRQRELASQTRIAHGTQYTYLCACTQKFIRVRAMMLNPSESPLKYRRAPARLKAGRIGGLMRGQGKAMIYVPTQCMQFSWPVNAKRSI
jgi:hypothetical protein